MTSYLVSVFTNTYFLLFVTAALGAALGKIKIKGFSLGGTGGIFVGIFIGWLVTAVAKTVPETSAYYDKASSIISGGLVPQSFMMFFLILFIASIGLSVGGKIKSALNKTGLKLVVLGILIPIVAMALTVGCLKVGPSLMGKSYNGYAISGLYSGSMTNTAALGTSMEVVGNMAGDVQERYAALDDADKTRVLEMIGAEDTTPTESLTQEQVGAFLGKAKAGIGTGYAISFPVGTVGIILAMTLLSIATKKKKPAGEHAQGGGGAFGGGKGDDNGKPFMYSAVIFGLVIAVGILLGSIEIPLGKSVSFSLSAVGGVLISALVFSNIPKIGPFDLTMNPKTLGFLREFSLIFFMSVMGLLYGYNVVSALSGSMFILAIMALVVEVIGILVAIFVGRILMKMNWGMLAGAICGGCTSAVGLGTALSTMDSDEPIVGYGISQPFAILANVILISLFHSYFFI
ncbi:MAG: hypothetical protein ACI3XJ_01740 [Oscillospiraceae bacterium]